MSMNRIDRFLTNTIMVFTFVLVILFSINIGRSLAMADAKYNLSTYEGVGAHVYKHGTIVKVVDDKPVIVGTFHDDSGVEYPGTLQIEEVK